MARGDDHAIGGSGLAGQVGFIKAIVSNARDGYYKKDERDAAEIVTAARTFNGRLTGVDE